ncbi:MAG: hypothetical protein M3220_20420 [Chloroflexota bacterium]|nr:hypothetical protein [Chloroflexota bacterium]
MAALGEDKVDRRRPLRKSGTAFLVLMGDFVSIICIIGVVMLYDELIWRSLPPHWRGVGFVGFGLVWIRLISLTIFYGTWKRTASTSNEALDDEGDRGKAKTPEDFRREAEARIDRYHRTYWVMLATGIVGYALIVTTTGGPFQSPFAPLLIAGLFLGQVRAATRESLRFLLYAGVALVGASVVLANAPIHGFGIAYRDEMTFQWSAYVPAALVVALVTTWVNERTLFRGAQGTGGDSKDLDQPLIDQPLMDADNTNDQDPDDWTPNA